MLIIQLLSLVVVLYMVTNKKPACDQGGRKMILGRGAPWGGGGGGGI